MWLKKISQVQLPQFVRRSVAQQQKRVSPFPAPAPDFEFHRCGFQSRMAGWELHEYGDFPAVLQFHGNLRVPKIEEAEEVVVRVRAASVNPLDLAMAGGYGSSVLNVLRRTDQELPLRLGRDFAGEIVYRGFGVDKQLRKGALVWGVCPPHKSGCFAELVKVHQDHVALKPTTLTTEEAAVVPYAALTAWSGLFLTGNLRGCGGGNSSAAGKKVLILGAAGGVGSMAVQMCRAENCHVIGTGARDAEELIRKLGADQFIDYGGEHYERDLGALGEIDLILDCAGRGTDYARAHQWRFQNYVTFSSPLLRNVDADGLVGGGLKSVAEIVRANCGLAQGGGQAATPATQGHPAAPSATAGVVKWAYFVAHRQGMKYIRQLAEKGQLRPVISHRVPFRELPAAFELLDGGHLRGKVAVNFD